jgi:hypothetical protein
MKNKIMIKVTMIAILIAVMTSPAFAGILRSSISIRSYIATVAATGNGKFDIDFYVAANISADSIGATEITVQRKVGSTWTNIQTFNSNTTSSLLTNNALSYAETITVYGTSGAEYRAIVKFIASAGSASDTKTITTSSIVA